MNVTSSFYVHRKMSGHVVGTRNNMAAVQADKRYLEKLSLIGGIDPYKIEKALWHVDDDLFPRVTYADLFNYLICAPSPFTSNELKSYKGLDAYNQFVCGWVRDVAVFARDDLRVVTSRVMHSQRMNEPALNPWVIAKTSGEIQAAHCNCMAGLGEACTHIAATLFWLDAKEKLRSAKTVTQEKAYWLLPGGVKKIPCAKISEIDFTSAKTKKQKLDKAVSSDVFCNPTYKPQEQHSASSIKLPAAPSEEELNSLYSALSSSDTKPAILSIIPQYSDAYVPKSTSPKLPPVLSESLFDPEVSGSTFDNILQKCAESFSNISVSQDEAVTVEKLTKCQSQSKLWFRMRAGRITASKFKSACVSDPDKPSQSLINSICHPESIKFTTKATQWGCDHEKVARQVYTEKLASSHQNFTVSDSGFVLNPDYPHMGASPDGIVDCHCCGSGALEIKCPFCQRDEFLYTTNSPFLENIDGKLQLKHNHMYYYQVQCQLFICEKEYCDFVVYTQKDIHIERIVPNAPFWEEAVSKATEFFTKAVMPELVAKFYSTPSNVPQVTGSCEATQGQFTSESYCYCQGPESDRMIACDNLTCKWKWFHFKCLKMRTAPRGNWFCPDCRKTS